MRLLRHLAPWAIAAVILVPVATDAQTYRRPQRNAGPPATLPNFPDCVKVRGEVRYRVGYNHVVQIRNECGAPIHCDVSTNVDPAPLYPVDLGANEATEVQTRIGSSAAVFEPRVICRPR